MTTTAHERLLAASRLTSARRRVTPPPMAAAPTPPPSEMSIAAAVSPPQPPIDPTATAKTLKALRLPSHAAALLCVPTGFDDLRHAITLVRDHPLESESLFLLQITGEAQAFNDKGQQLSYQPHGSWASAPWPGYWSQVKRITLDLHDEEGALVKMTVFGPQKKLLQGPSSLLALGSLKQFRHLSLQVKSILDVDQAGRIVARYTNTETVASEASIRSLIHQALGTPEASARECLDILSRSTLLTESQMLSVALQSTGQVFDSMLQLLLAMHQPRDLDLARAACAAARAIAVQGVIHAAAILNTRRPHPQSVLSVRDDDVKALIALQPEQLTSDQHEAISALTAGLRSPTPMNALLSGDVGTGKTLPLLIAAVATQMAGGRCSITAPTEILANQIYANLKRRFPAAKAERVLAGKRIQDAQAILVSTQGLSSVAARQNYVPNLLIIDEQHKLSTQLKSSLVGPYTHLVEASATPIPRTLAHTIFNGTQVISLKQAPVQRQLQSHLLDANSKGQINQWIRQNLNEGHRAAIIYPKVEQKGQDDLSVTRTFESLKQVFPDVVDMIHGKLKSEEINQALDRFRSGQTRLMVASTIMETGIDVPDIRLLIVRDADNFSASQLHQLRGRLARNGGHGRFILMVTDIESLAPETRERLQTVVTITNGYELAEADMRMRGFGDLAGTAQSGNALTPFRLLHLQFEDFEVEATGSTPAANADHAAQSHMPQRF